MNTCALALPLVFFLHFGLSIRTPTYIEAAVVFLRNTQQIPPQTAFIGFPYLNQSSVIDTFDPWSPNFVMEVEEAAEAYGLVVVDGHHDYLVYPRNPWTMIYAAVKLCVYDGWVMVVNGPEKKQLLLFKKTAKESA